MKISIITACMNAGNTIEETILSVINQTYFDIEYIIIDGASTDNTVNIIDKHKDKISYFVSEPDSGIYEAMNKGINASTGDYLFFLNADDTFLHNNMIKLVVNKISKNTAELVWGDLAFLDKRSGKFYIKKQDKLNKIYLLKNTPPQPALFYKKSVFDKVGLFNANYKIVSDHEFILKALLEHKVSYKYVGFPITIFNIGGISTNPAGAMHNKEKMEMLSQFYTPFERKIYNLIAKWLKIQ
ncbi:MAG: cell wall biogenesis glycosyltransferase [uncultured bacterium]|nr:MAG: cell wall biogenesis glycosyltransferase [uncultured bacterium]